MLIDHSPRLDRARLPLRALRLLANNAVCLLEQFCTLRRNLALGRVQMQHFRSGTLLESHLILIVHCGR